MRCQASCWILAHSVVVVHSVNTALPSALATDIPFDTVCHYAEWQVALHWVSFVCTHFLCCICYVILVTIGVWFPIAYAVVGMLVSGDHFVFSFYNTQSTKKKKIKPQNLPKLLCVSFLCKKTWFLNFVYSHLMWFLLHMSNNASTAEKLQVTYLWSWMQG